MPSSERSAPARLISYGIIAYRNTLSHMMLHHCGFWPSCSQYALDAVERHGAFRGSWMAMRRVLRCHPFSRGGVDPVA